MAKNLRLFAGHNKPNHQGYQAEIDKIIDYSKASGKQGIRNLISDYLSDLKINLILNIINSTISSLLILVYIYSTYNPQPFENLAWGVTNFLFHIYFLFEYCLRLYASRDRKIFFYSTESIVDFFSLIPFFFIRFFSQNPFDEDFSNPWHNISNFLCLLRLLKFEGCLIFIVFFKKSYIFIYF